MWGLRVSATSKPTLPPSPVPVHARLAGTSEHRQGELRHPRDILRTSSQLSTRALSLSHEDGAGALGLWISGGAWSTKAYSVH